MSNLGRRSFLRWLGLAAPAALVAVKEIEARVVHPPPEPEPQDDLERMDELSEELLGSGGMSLPVMARKQAELNRLLSIQVDKLARKR